MTTTTTHHHHHPYPPPRAMNYHDLTDPLAISFLKAQRELERLNISLALQELWPEAFGWGPLTPRWIANGYGHLRVLELRRPDGESKRFTMDQLPDWLVEHGKRHVEDAR